MTDQEILLIATEECELNEYADECLLEDNLHECETQILKFARIMYQKGSDNMLERVIKWAHRNCWCWFEKSSQEKSFTQELEKAMRPQQQEDN